MQNKTPSIFLYDSAVYNRYIEASTILKASDGIPGRRFPNMEHFGATSKFFLFNTTTPKK
jgi:hypothetical protein